MVDDYLTVKQVASKLHVTKQTVYRYFKSGLLTHYKIAGRTLIKESEINALIQSLNSIKKKEPIEVSA